MNALKREGVLTGGASDPSGLPLPPGFDGEWLEDKLMVEASTAAAKRAEAETLPKILLTDMDMNWMQVIGEGWAAPLTGFMREGPLLQSLHFNSLLIDPTNNTGAVDLNTQQTDWNDYFTRGNERASSSVPIVLPATAFTKSEIESSGKKAAALVDKDGKTWGIIRNPEIYVNRKEEIVSRCFGVIDPGHPYIQHIYKGGDYLIGGEIELFERIQYNDGLDQWRRSPKELYGEFKAKGADVVFAFQTRNPTHAG